MAKKRLQFTRVHVSGRFDQKVAAWARMVRYYVRLCTVLAVTEIDNNARARVLKQPGWNPTWGNKGPRDDCGLTSKIEQWKVVHEETYTVTHHRYRNERGNLADTTEAAYQITEDRESGKRVVQGSIHTAHGMTAEIKSGKIRSDVAQAYVGMVDGFFQHAEELMKEYDAEMGAISGDFNLDFREAWVRAWFKRRYPKWSVNWNPKQMPARGTHGKRAIIDATFLIGLRPKGRIRILKDDPTDDHTGYVEDLVEVA